MARAIGVPLLSFSTDTSVAGAGVGLMGILPGQQVRRITDFAARNGKRRFGLLAPQGALGDLVERAYRAAAADLGLELVVVSRYGGEFASMRQAVNDLFTNDGRDAAIEEQLAVLAGRTDPAAERARARLEAMRNNSTPTFAFDALLIAESGQPLRQLMLLLAQVGIDGRSQQILGLGLWDAERALGLEPTLVGAWYAAPPAQQRDRFFTRYVSTYDRQPIRLITLAYDAISLAGTLMADAGLEGISMTDLVTPTGFQGVDGLFRFRTDGLNERVLAIYEIRRGDAVVVDPAPRSFALATTQVLLPTAANPVASVPTETTLNPVPPTQAKSNTTSLVGD
jgi:ABC-type branched-subunit amino acid transport system substrate-binding protein